MVIGRTGDGDRRIVDSEFIEFQRGKAVPETFVDGAVQWSELKYHRRWRFSLIVHARISLQFDLCRRESMAVVGNKKEESCKEHRVNQSWSAFNRSKPKPVYF